MYIHTLETGLIILSMFAGSKYRIELSKFSLLQDYKQMTISLRRSLELVISAVLLISAYLQFTVSSLPGYFQFYTIAHIYNVQKNNW